MENHLNLRLVLKLGFIIGTLSSSLLACRHAGQGADVKADIVGTDGSIQSINLSTFIARRGECDGPGGLEIAGQSNMRYSQASFDHAGATLMIRNFEEERKPLASIVTDYERGLLIAYTGGLYRNLNAWLRGDKDRIGEVERNVPDAEWSRRALCLASAVNKMAEYQGGYSRMQIYRGAGLRPESIVGRYQKGKMINPPERSFLSYSMDKKVALNYAGVGNDQGRTSVVFVLQGGGKIGFNIEPISSFEEEKEVLVNADQSFCVENIEDKPVEEFDPGHPKKGTMIKIITLSTSKSDCGG